MATKNTYFGLNFMDWREADSITPYRWKNPDYSIQDHIKDDYGRNYGLAPLSYNWFGALEINLGRPLGYAKDYEKDVMIREYKNAVVIVSLVYNLKTTEIDLDKIYPKQEFKLLNVDGKLEEINRKINLRNPEALILIKVFNKR